MTDRNYYFLKLPRDEIEIEGELTEYETFIKPRELMPRIPLTSDSKRKVYRLCWVFNCREVFAEEFNLQIRDDHYTS